ncbi:histone-like nucleoid structuring protein [Aeromonas dhakensis]|uniref:histone-like nucleoid structuring protein n=1 Tax=Aeromonas dhakensis TaxID=196024 RepID=UPI0038CFEADE
MPKEERRIPIVISERENANKHEKTEPGKTIRTRKIKSHTRAKKEKTIAKPYSIYDCNAEWLRAAKSIKRYEPHAVIKEGVTKHGLSIQTASAFERFTIENKSIDPEYNNGKWMHGDEEYFERIYSLLDFIASTRKYNYHVAPKVGRRLEKYNRLEHINADIAKNVYMEHFNRLQVFSDEQKKNLKKEVKKLLKSNVNALADDDSNYLQYFNTHPAVSIFIKAVKVNNIYTKYEGFNEQYSMDEITAFVNYFNFIFDQQGYKRVVSKRLFNIMENIKAATGYVAYQIEMEARQVIRFCLGFNCERDDEYDRGFENELNAKIKSPEELKDFRLNKLIDGRNAIFRNGKKRAVMCYIDGYLWKFDYCSERGYYIHMFLFLNENWKESFNIMEAIGNIWRGAVQNGDVFAYVGGKDNFDLGDEKNHQKLFDDVTKLFNQDVLAYVDTTLSNGKKQRIFGKGVMHSIR